MNKILIIAVSLFFLSCKKSIPSPEKPELDFASTNFLTISEFLDYKISIPCSTSTPYWEEKMISMQGFIFDVASNKGSFTLYSTLNYSDPNAKRLFCRINPVDSVAIYDKLYKNLDKKCFIKTICKTGIIQDSNCDKILIPTLMSANDVAF